jgi:large repetitive protein
MTVDSGSSFTDPGATANDACAGSVAVMTSGTVDVTTPGTYTLTYNATDGTNAATPVTRTVIVVPVADVAVTQSASPSVPTGSMLTYSIVVSNAGPQAAQGVSLTDTLPVGTSFVSATATAGTLTTPRGNGSTVSWSAATLASGPGVTLTLVVKVGARAGATLTNTASVTSSSPRDPRLANNSASVSTAVLPRH